MTPGGTEKAPGEGRAPRARKAKAPGGGGQRVTVRQVRSGIGFAVDQKRTLEALGLGRIGRERTHPDNPAVRGMIYKVRHLVEVVGAPKAGA